MHLRWGRELVVAGKGLDQISAGVILEGSFGVGLTWMRESCVSQTDMTLQCPY